MGVSDSERILMIRVQPFLIQYTRGTGTDGQTDGQTELAWHRYMYTRYSIYMYALTRNENYWKEGQTLSMFIFEMHRTGTTGTQTSLFGLRYTTYIFSVKFHRLRIYKSHSKLCKLLQTKIPMPCQSNYPSVWSVVMLCSHGNWCGSCHYSEVVELTTNDLMLTSQNHFNMTTLKRLLLLSLLLLLLLLSCGPYITMLHADIVFLCKEGRI